MKTGIAAIAITGMMCAGFMSSQTRPPGQAMVALAAQAVPQTAPAPDRNIAPAGAQRPATQQPQKQTPGARAPQPISPKSDGVIEGFVYWDTSLIVHKPADSCNGLAVTVSVDNGLSGPFKGFKPLATLTNNFKYVGQVKTFLAGGKVVTYGVCTYGYDQVPVGPELQVQLTVTRAFALNATPQPPVVGPITIINGQCNMLPSLNPTQLADLTAHWGSCQKMAYNVNFALQQAMQTLSATGESQLTLGGAGAHVSNLGNKVTLGPQPLPPKTAAPASLPMTLKAGPLNTSPVVKNAIAAKNSASITAQLQIQRQNADQEASQMKLGLRPAGSSGAVNNRAATSGTKIQNAAKVGSVGPAKTMSSGNLNLGSTAPSPFNDLLILCGHDPTMRIVRVTGKSTPATFTPDSRFNFYTIAGCSFGDPGPNAKVYIYFQNTFHQDFKVQEWNDNAISLQLDNNLSGVLDQDSVALVVQRADGKQAVKNGFKFYAARETRLLSKILQQDWSLQHFTTNDVSKLTSQYFSPSEHGASQGFPRGWSAAVSWTEAPPLQADEDVYTFRDLAPGFETDSAAAAEIDIDCDNQQGMQRAGNLGLNWDDKGYLHVQWQGQACTEQMPGVMGTKGDTFYSSGANYVLNVWVTGPRGVDPWSGKPLTGLLH